MGCGAWKPCFLEVVSEGEDNMSNDEEIASPQDVTSHFQNILLIQGILIKQHFYAFFYIPDISTPKRIPSTPDTYHQVYPHIRGSDPLQAGYVF